MRPVAERLIYRAAAPAKCKRRFVQGEAAAVGIHLDVRHPNPPRPSGAQASDGALGALRLTVPKVVTGQIKGEDDEKLVAELSDSWRARLGSPAGF